MQAGGVGAYVGQVVMDGLMHWRTPLPTRRALTMSACPIILALAVNTSQAPVDSQIIQSFDVPFALIPCCSSPATPAS